MKTVLLTGATGYIGRHAIDPLLSRGFEVHAISRKKHAERDDISWHSADLLDSVDVERICKAIDATHLLHFAWYVDPKDYKTSEKNKEWQRAGGELLERFSAHGGKRAVIAGTCMEYDWTTNLTKFSEDSPLAPANPYGTAKNELRKFAETYAKKNGISLAWGRIFYSFGPYEAASRVVPSVIRALLKDQAALCTSGEQIRDFLYVKDLGDAFAALLDSGAEGAVNIGSGKELAVKDLVMKLGERLGKSELVRLGAIPTPTNEPERVIADIKRLQGEVRWQPRYALERSIDETISWWKNYTAQGLST